MNIPGTLGYIPSEKLESVPEMRTRVLHPDITQLSREEWLELRRKGIGGSDVGSILGVGFHSALTTWADKTGRAKHAKKPDNWFRLEYGNRIEPLMRQWYADVTGFNVIEDHRMLCKPLFKNGYAIADVDGIVEVKKEDGTTEKAILEIKTTAAVNIGLKWCSGVLGETGRLPAAYELQVRHYMMVTDINRAFVVCSYGNDDSDIAIVQITRDSQLEAVIYDVEKRFWEENVLKDISPDMEGLRKTDYKSLEERNLPDKTLSGKDMPPYAESILEHILELEEKEEVLEELLVEIREKKNLDKFKLLAALDKSNEGVLTMKNGRRYRIFRQPYSRTIPDSKKLKTMYPEVWEKVKKTTSSMPLRYKEITGETKNE